MSSKRFTEEELRDSLVIDRGGYICGYVDSVSVEPTNIMVRLYAYDIQKTEITDEDELVKRLLPTVPRMGILHQEQSLEEFYDYVRETLNLSKKEPMTFDCYAKYARTKNIEIPKKIREQRVKIERGTVYWPTIEKIAFTDLGKCIMLKEAIEAQKRGLLIDEKVDYKDTEYVAGKLVLDADAKIIGSVAKFLIGSPPGLLINIERLSREQRPDVEELKKFLISLRFANMKQLLDQVKKDLRLEGPPDDVNVVIWASRNGIEVKNTMVEVRDVVMELPISWDKILRIGDVVVLKEPVDQLTKYY